MRADIPESATPSRESGRVTLVVFSALLVLYGASLAPDLTLWDAGEFNSAIATLGIPHPPGTPLYILVGRVWSRLFGFVPQVVAVNALSAVASALACAVLGALVARWSRSRVMGIAAGIGAGLVSAVWQNATETEVYALSLLLAALMVYAGERAGDTGDSRWVALLVYCMGLAIPLQISALVAAPAGILLAASPRGRRRDHVLIISLGALLLIAIGAGRVATVPVVVGFLLFVGASAISVRRAGARTLGRALGYAAVMTLGVSAVLFMLVRSAHDPGINQGNPSTWRALLDVVGRHQYNVPSLWPRRAPVWIQLGNLVQYADWQVALGLDGGVAPSWARTPWSVAYGMLAVIGARWHWRRDARSAAAVLLLLLGSSLGVVAVLNLHAGPSIGVGVLPSGSPHEARERDYFFALAFATLAAWAAVGAVALVRRRRERWAWTGVAIAALPALLNWGATNRRRDPDTALAPVLGAMLLESSPPHSVLLLSGDNDSYSTWYQQRVHGTRVDVTPVTVPLLGADWYRAELARRDSLLTPVDARYPWTGTAATLRELSANALAHGRPVVAAASVDSATRRSLGMLWTRRGVVFVAGDWIGDGPAGRTPEQVDSARTREIAMRISRLVPRLDRPARDPAGDYVAWILSCPARSLDPKASVSGATGIDQRC